MEKYNDVSVFDVGDKFAQFLRAELTAAEWKKMRADNAAETVGGICHSHDYCDANEVMAAAFSEFDLPDVTDEGATDELRRFWSSAWDYAFIKHFCG